MGSDVPGDRRNRLRVAMVVLRIERTFYIALPDRDRLRRMVLLAEPRELKPCLRRPARCRRRVSPVASPLRTLVRVSDCGYSRSSMTLPDLNPHKVALNPS